MKQWDLADQVKYQLCILTKIGGGGATAPKVQEVKKIFVAPPGTAYDYNYFILQHFVTILIIVIKFGSYFSNL